jgi:hypothetical protein
MTRKGLLAAIVTGVMLAGGSTAEPALVAAPPVSVGWVEPAAPRSGAYVERVAAPYEGGVETWLLNLDVQLKNTQTPGLRVERLAISYPGTSIPTRTQSYSARDPAVALGSFKSVAIPVPETRFLEFPLPATVSVSFHFRGFRDPIVVTRRLVEWKSAVAGGAYRFPIAREDLPEGTYVSDNDTHVVGSGHRGAQGQQFAYDYGVFRWGGSEWTNLVKNGDKKKNDDYLIWDVPIRAMADGWVLRCTFSLPDQKPGDKIGGGGNSFRIVHASGEVALYAHMRFETVSRTLCPREGVDFRPGTVRVKAGQVLGHAGNTGQSSNPHLHIHIGTTGQTGEQGRPLVFRDARVRYAGTDWKGSPPCSETNKPFARVTRAASGPWQLVDPLYRPGHSEIAWHGLEDTCFQDLAEAVTQARYGVSWLSGFDASGKTRLNVVFAASAPQVVRIGLVATQYQAELEKAVAAGYRPTHVESYVRGGQARYAFAAEKKSGPGYRAYHGVSAAQHEAFVKQLKAEGLTPVAVSVVAPGGAVRYTALWEKRNVGSWQLRSAIPLAQYQTWLATEAKAGRKLVYLDAWMSGGKAMLSAIVTSMAGAAYVARHNLTASEYQKEYDAWTGKGLRTRAVTAYRVGSSVRYAALWR